MIRFAPSATPASSQQSTKAAGHVAVPLKAEADPPVIALAKAANESKEIADSGMLLADLPEISAPNPPKTTKARRPRKPKTKSQAIAIQLDLNGQTA